MACFLFTMDNVSLLVFVMVESIETLLLFEFMDIKGPLNTKIITNNSEYWGLKRFNLGFEYYFCKRINEKIRNISTVKKIQLAIILIIIVLMNNTSYASLGSPYKIKTVVIDAGHGGHDVGCIGSHSKEKDVTLALALKLGKYLEENYPDIRVVYTRKTDEFIELIERANIANRAKADLFISLHCNANANKAAYGSETFAMGLHVSEANLNVAKRENSVILLEDNYEKNYDGFDPKSTEAYIIFSLYQNVNIDKSLYLASKVQDQFTNKLKRYNRGVKQAGFIVLYKTNMPSILIESGFLTNKDDEEFLTSEEGQNNIAKSIYLAFKAYKEDLEKEK